MLSRPIWTEDEIENLKQEYLKGQRIKVIARQLNRTASAVNKALARFSIRPERKWRPRISVKAFKGEVKARERDRTVCLEKWVSMDQVVAWLEKEGITLVAVDDVFYRGAEKLSSLNVLLLANKRRLSQGKSKFYVTDVTWM